MFNPKLGPLAHRLLNNRNNSGLTLAAGVGVGIFASGSGILPALVGVAAVSAGAVALRGLWEEFKRKHLVAGYKDIEVQWNDITGDKSRSTPEQKVTKYDHFLGVVKKSMDSQESAGLQHVSWMHQLSTAVSKDIHAATGNQQNKGALEELHTKIQNVLKPALKRVAENTYYDAINWRVDRDLPAMTLNINRMNTAVQANAIAVAVLTDDTSEVKMLSERHFHLQNKVGVFKDTAEKGILLGNETPASAQPALQHIIDSISRMSGQLSPVALTIEREAPVPEKLTDTVQYEDSMYSPEKRENAILYSAWNNSFERGSASLDPEKVIGHIQAVYEKLVERATLRYKPDMDAAPIFLAEKLYDRMSEVKKFEGHTSKTREELSRLQKATEDYLIDYAPRASIGVGIDLEHFQRVGRHAKQILEQTRMTRDAAMLHMVSSRFAPEFEATNAVRSIQRHHNKVLEQLAKPYPGAVSEWKAASEEAKNTTRLVEQMHAFEQTKPRRIADNEKTPTLSFARLGKEWSKTFRSDIDIKVPERVLGAYETFNNTFKAYIKQHEPDSHTLELANLMHKGLGDSLNRLMREGVGDSLSNFRSKEQVAEGLNALMAQTKDYLVANAPGVAARAIEKLEAAPPMVSYSDVSYQTARLGSAASAQLLASTYAPNAKVDSKNIERIEHQASQIKASMAMGPSTDEKNMFILEGTTAHETVAMLISKADTTIEHIRNTHELSLEVSTSMDPAPT